MRAGLAGVQHDVREGLAYGPVKGGSRVWWSCDRCPAGGEAGDVDDACEVAMWHVQRHHASHAEPVTSPAQAAAVRSWWADLDPVDRRRVLALRGDEALAEDLARGLVFAGVTVIPLDASPVDGRPAGYVAPAVLLAHLQEQRRDDPLVP